MSQSLISELNGCSPNLTIQFLRGEGGSHDVDILLRGVVTQWWCLITKGGGGDQESGKKWLHNLNYVTNYVIRKLLSN